MPDLHDLTLMLRLGTPLVIIECDEEKRVLELLTRIALSLGKPLYQWSCTQGLKRGEIDDEAPLAMTKEPLPALDKLAKQTGPTLGVFCDFHPFLVDEPQIVRFIKEMAMGEYGQHTLVFVSHEFGIPAEWQSLAAQFSLNLPNDEQLRKIIREEAARWSKAHSGRKVKADMQTLQVVIENLKGLSHSDARKIARSLIENDGAITIEDIDQLNKAKFRLLDKEGLLHYEYQTKRFADVAGLSKLKSWLKPRQEYFAQLSQSSGNAATLDPPRGLLLLGVQGSGKSLAAKAIAGLFKQPLLRLDFGALFNKYIGETEKNLRECLALADSMSPCVLWIDEIEKGISTESQDTGTSQRILGTFLTWMSERTAPVFLAATSNNIQCLPAELLRKGRFDEIFFVDLPQSEIREEILRIHLQKRGLSTDDFDITRLATACHGFSGAEIEEAVVSGLYHAHADNSPLNTDKLMQIIEQTRPLSIVMAEQIAALRAWASERTVSAD
jgi:SpoVK/Ycf46/Vps4 family AAA+-type ATPase